MQYNAFLLWLVFLLLSNCQ